MCWPYAGSQGIPSPIGAGAANHITPSEGVPFFTAIACRCEEISYGVQPGGKPLCSGCGWISGERCAAAGEWHSWESKEKWKSALGISINRARSVARCQGCCKTLIKSRPPGSLPRSGLEHADYPSSSPHRYLSARSRDRPGRRSHPGPTPLVPPREKRAYP
jgi:hypothetical protein